MRYIPTPLPSDSLVVLPPRLRVRSRQPRRRTPPVTVLLLVACVALLGWLWQVPRLDRTEGEFIPSTSETAMSDPVLTAAPAPLRELLNPEHRYLDRARALYEQAVRVGAVNYTQVLQAAYAPATLTPQILARKSAYRKRWRHSCTFLADYRLANDPITVKEGRPVYDPVLRGWTRGLHSSAESLIILTRGSPATVLFHESGHAIQTTGPAPANVSDRHTYAAFQAGRIDDASERRLRYLAGQRELEVSLQDLNRFHAVVLTGRPIMDARQAITALTAIGLPLTYDEVRPVFLAEKKDLTLGQFQILWRRFPEDPAEKARRKNTWPDAQRLVELRELTLRADPSLWPPLLRKFLFEAPGHL